jgi:hypothetical protein
MARVTAARCPDCNGSRSVTHWTTKRHRDAMAAKSGDTLGPVRDKGAEFASRMRAARRQPVVTDEENGLAAARLAGIYGSVIVPNDPSADDCAMVDEMRDATGAPVLRVIRTVPAPRQRPTCERCGQTFRVTGTGYDWHLANRPDCAARLAVVA